MQLMTMYIVYTQVSLILHLITAVEAGPMNMKSMTQTLDVFVIHMSANTVM